MAEPFRETQDNLVAALLCLARAQLNWNGRSDVQAELVRAGAAVADVMDLVASAEVLAGQTPPYRAEEGRIEVVRGS